MFPAYSVKTHMIISTSILLTTARRAIFQGGARGVRSAVFCDALLHMYPYIYVYMDFFSDVSGLCFLALC